MHSDGTMSSRNRAFRAPPPSPIPTAHGIKSAAVNDEILSEFLEHSLRIPDLILPDPLIRTDIPDQDLPAFDFFSLRSDDDPKESGVLRLVQSAIEFGCFQLINHGILPELTQTAVKECIRLFQLPLDQKQMVCRSPDQYHFGFEEIDSDAVGPTVRVQETFWVDKNIEMMEEFMRDIWPEGYKNFSSAMSNYWAAMESIAAEILGILSKGLDLDPSYLKELVGSENESVLCLYNHKGPYKSPSARLRHSQSHILSVHYHKRSSGFYIYADHGWIPVKLKPDSLLVTVGGILKVWSNGRCKNVRGRPIHSGDRHFISMEFLYSSPTHICRSGGIDSIQISLVDQLLTVLILLFLWQLFINFQQRA